MLRDLAGRTATTQANARNVVARLRPVAGRRQVAFKGVRPSVRVFAEAPAGGKAAEAAIALADVKEGSEYEGTVTAVEEFGAFVNFGSTTNGLVHISKLAAGFTKNAKDVVSVGQKVTVKVLSVDAAKNRVSLSLSGAAAAPAGAESSASDEVVDFADDIKEEKEQQDEEEEDVEVELEDGQFEVRADLPGFEDIPFVMEEDVEEFSEAAISALEANLDAAEIQYQLDNPPYLAEVAGTVSRVENYGIFLDFEWNGKTLTGLLPREEMKVPSALLAEDVKAALRAEWADTEFEMPEYAEVSDDQLNVAKFYKVGDSVAAFVLESQLVSDKIQLTHFTDEEVAGEAVELFEELDEDEDEELDTLINDAEEALAEEALAFEPDALLEDDEDGAIAAVGGAEFEDYDEERIIGAEGNFHFGVTRAGLIKGKNGYQVSPMGLPSRGTDEVNANGVAILGAQEVDFGGDVVQLFDYFDSAAYDAVPKDALKRVGLKMSYNEAGEAEFTEREGHEDDEDALLSLLYEGDVEKRAADLVADLLDDDEDEAELPARAGRRPVVLAAAVQNISAADVKALRNATGAGMMDCKKALAECGGNAEEAAEWLRKKGLSGADKKSGRIAAEGAVVRYIHPGSRLGVLLEVNCETDFVAASDAFQKLVNELGMIIAATDCICVNPEDVPEEVLAKEREVELGKDDLSKKPEAIRTKIVEGRLDKIRNQMALTNQMTLSNPDKTVAEMVKETIAAVGENIKIRRFIKYRLGEGIEKKSNDFAAEVAQQTQAKAPAPPKVEEPKKEEPKKEAKPLVAVAASVVKTLRDATGAGMMDCKKALAECEGDMAKATEWLRMKGLAGADKKAGRIAAEGVVASYIHPGSRLGVLLEVNCETDFVAASEKFNQLVNYIAMGIVAGQNVQYVSADEIPAEVFEREKQLEMAREDLKGKPEAIRAKIAEGRAKKIAQEMCLLDQPFLTDNSKTVADAIKEAIAAIGEKISVRRFVKFQLGEGLEKKSNDFAAEVAAVTGQK